MAKKGKIQCSSTVVGNYGFTLIITDVLFVNVASCQHTHTHVPRCGSVILSSSLWVAEIPLVTLLRRPPNYIVEWRGRTLGTGN